MFDIFDLLISLYPQVPVHLLVSLRTRILISLCSCVLACILATLHPHILRFMCPHLHPCILISSGSCVLSYNLVSSHPFIIRLMYCVLVGILASSHPYILGSCNPGASWYTRILIFLRSCILGACWYPCIFISSGSSVRNQNQIKQWFQQKTAFMETNNGCNKFFTKQYIYNEN